jgi:hypothetical protein
MNASIRSAFFRKVEAAQGLAVALRDTNVWDRTPDS